MLRITETADVRDGTVILKIEGGITSAWVGELERVCHDRLARGRLVVIDLADVLFVDRRGAQALRSLADGAVEIRSCPALIREVLDEQAWRRE